MDPTNPSFYPVASGQASSQTTEGSGSPSSTSPPIQAALQALQASGEKRKREEEDEPHAEVKKPRSSTSLDFSATLMKEESVYEESDYWKNFFDREENFSSVYNPSEEEQSPTCFLSFVGSFDPQEDTESTRFSFNHDFGFSQSGFILDRDLERFSRSSQEASSLFSTVSNNTFTLPEDRSAYSGELLPVPREGIKMGLPNISLQGGFGNTCWLNALLKFLSATGSFDGLFSPSNSCPSEFASLKKEMRIIINCLRKHGERDQVLADSSYKQLLREIQKCFSGFRLGTQQDPFEFLLQLEMNFSCWQPPAERLPEKINCYTPVQADSVKSGRIDDDRFSTEMIALPCEYLKKKAIDLEEALQKRSELEARPDQGRDNLLFEQRTYYTRLPNQLVVYLNRAVNDEARVEKKVEAPIKLNAEHLVELTEYAEIRDASSKIRGAQPKKKCYYRIDASLVQRGIVSSGHYVCYERTGSKELREHNDKQVLSLADGREKFFGVEGSFILLTKVREEPIGQEVEEKEEKDSSREAEG